MTQAVGLDFKNVSGSPTQDYIMESSAGGAAFLDYDGDGWLDLFVVNGTRLEDPPETAKNHLFRNDNITGQEGAARRAFRQVDVDLGPPGWGMGCTTGDIDNDGNPDVYATYLGTNRLYRNDGNGRFAEIARQAGVADASWGASAAFGDLDGDGLLDLYVANYVEIDPENLPGKDVKCPYKGLWTSFAAPAASNAKPTASIAIPATTALPTRPPPPASTALPCRAWA